MKRFMVAVLILLVLLQGTGFVTAAEPADYSKIIIMHLNISENGITEKLVEMRYGHAPNIESRYGDIKGIIKSSDGSTIREFDVWDPRYQLGDFIENDNNSSEYLSGYLTYSANADLTLILPYYENQMTFELKDKKTGILLKEVNMSQAITNFQTTYPKDPGGVSVPHIRFEGPVIYLITGIVLSILIMGMIISMIRKK
ncbi:MAG TPA: hypothetical protein VMV55_00270 [Methanoregula sp.]|nr:hypothetical protein [Methanoregula sp.]